MPWPTSIKNEPSARAVRKSLEEIGFRILDNDAVALSSPASPSQAGGVGRKPAAVPGRDWLASRNDDHVAAALAQIGTVRRDWR